MNQMQDKIIAALRAIVDEWELEWVEIAQSPCQGIVRLLETGRFRTLLKIEYEFQPQRYKLLIYREGKHIGGRCSIDYDDGILIEQIIAQFRRLCGDGHPGPSGADRIADPIETAVDIPHHAASSRRDIAGSRALVPSFRMSQA